MAILIYHTFRNRRGLPQAEVISYHQLNTLEFILRHANHLHFEVTCILTPSIDDVTDATTQALAATVSRASTGSCHSAAVQLHQSSSTASAAVADEQLQLSRPGTSCQFAPPLTRRLRVPTPFVDLPSRENFIGVVTPLALAAMYGEHDALLLLLRYGALPFHVFGSRNRLRQQREQPIKILVANLNPRVPMLMEWRSATGAEGLQLPAGGVLGLARRFVLCLQFMLRADTSLIIKWKDMSSASSTQLVPPVPPPPPPPPLPNRASGARRSSTTENRPKHGARRLAARGRHRLGGQSSPETPPAQQSSPHGH